MEKKFKEMDTTMSAAIDKLTPELGKVVEEYQLQVNYEYLTWLKKLRALGFEAKTDVKAEFQKDMSLEARVENIRQILETSRVLANKVGQAVEETYGIIRALYDQTLPEQSRTITFAKQQLDKKIAPWFATDALFTALTNWKALYGKEVSKSVEYLQTSLGELVSLNVQTETLQPTLGDQYAKIKDCIERAQGIEHSLKIKVLSVPNLPFIRYALETSLAISKDVLTVLYELMERKEASIERLLPVKEDFWEKNVALKEQTAFAIKAIVEAPEQELNKTLAELPKALSQISICIDTLTTYTDKEELLLNYPVAKTAIEALLRQKKRITPRDLPFGSKYAEEYLRLFYTSQGEKNREFSYDAENLTLSKKS